MHLDGIDREIMAELSRDSRLSVRALAERVHISRSAAHARVSRLRDEGAIRGFTTKVDRRAAGLTVSALVIVTIDERAWREVADDFLKLPFVESVRAVSGDIDFVVEVNAPSQEELSSVVMSHMHAIPGVVTTRTHLVLHEHEGTPAAESLDSWHG